MKKIIKLIFFIIFLPLLFVTFKQQATFAQAMECCSDIDYYYASNDRSCHNILKPNQTLPPIACTTRPPVSYATCCFDADFYYDSTDGLCHSADFPNQRRTPVLCGILTPTAPPAVRATPGSVEQIIGQITPPPQVQALGVGGAGIGRFLGNLVRIIFLFAGIVAIFMILISAFQMITSGGDKEAVAKARGRLTYAIIGLTLLALTFVIINVISRLTGFQFPIVQR